MPGRIRRVGRVAVHVQIPKRQPFIEQVLALAINMRRVCGGRDLCGLGEAPDTQDIVDKGNRALGVGRTDPDLRTWCLALTDGASILRMVATVTCERADERSAAYSLS